MYGRKNLEYDARPGWPITDAPPEMVCKYTP